MKKPTLYGLEITLTCPKCHKECPMYGYEPGRSDLPDNINQAWVNHQAEALCQPPGCKFCGETGSVLKEGDHLNTRDCIKHLRKLIKNLEEKHRE